jgi:hypothetical protein
MGDFLNFKKFITPVIIVALFWVAVVFVVLGGLVTMFQDGGALPGLLMVLLGPIAVRVYAELLILAFKIYDRLGEISANTSRDGAAG